MLIHLFLYHGAKLTCLRSLAHLESRLVLAKLFWNYNVKVDAGNERWRERQKSYLLWDKTDFYATLEPAR
jgi:hypothetical protein